VIEAYAFLAAFPVQILAMSVLYPVWFIKRVREQALGFPPELFAQLFPDVDLHRSVERFTRRYRALNAAIAVLGLLVLGWLFNYMQRADWGVGVVKALVSVYFIVQMVPLLLVALLGIRYRKVLAHSMADGKRKAVLQRRGLFDFVSPFVVGLAALMYVLFAAFVIYIEQHPFSGFAGLKSMLGITFVYALAGCVAYKYLYGKKNPLQTHENRVHTIGVTVRVGVYTCIVSVVFVSLVFALRLLELQRWEPFALSVFFVITTLLCSIGLIAPPRTPNSAGPDVVTSQRSAYRA